MQPTLRQVPPRAYSPLGVCHFSMQAVARPSYLATDWNFLLDGVATVTFYGGGTPYIAMCPGSSPPPTVTVTEAVFIIDAEFPDLIKPTTWGQIKALYR